MHFVPLTSFADLPFFNVFPSFSDRTSNRSLTSDAHCKLYTSFVSQFSFLLYCRILHHPGAPLPMCVCLLACLFLWIAGISSFVRASFFSIFSPCFRLAELTGFEVNAHASRCVIKFEELVSLWGELYDEFNKRYF